MISRRFFCSHASSQTSSTEKWRIKQVTKSNFNQLLDEVKTHISTADFVAISLRNTGAFSAPWQKVQPFDTAETAYSKARRAAERFQIFQFAVCPFTLKDSKLTAYPYNFHLFPRDELRLGVPAYSFSCQTSYLASMAQVGFDFNMCIYEGISYLSKAQESKAVHRLGVAFSSDETIQPAAPSSVADILFVDRMKSRVRNWRNACKTDKTLVNTMKKLIVGGEGYGSRPCVDIDVCSQRQVQLVLEGLKEFTEDIVPVLIPQKNGEIQSVRIVLSSSKEDKTLFEDELKERKEKEKRNIRGFGAVINLITASKKPVVARNALDDFTFIHSKFLGPLPATVNDFKHSLESSFPHILDLNQLIKELSPRNSLNNVPAALSYMRNRFFAPISIETPHEGESTDENEGKVHGDNVLRVSRLYAKLTHVLKQTNSNPEKEFAFPNDDDNDDVTVLSSKNENVRKLTSADLVFFWGFGHTPTGELKKLLVGSHEALSNENLFDLKLVDNGCAVAAFWSPGSARALVESVISGNFGSEKLETLVSEGLGVAGYELYKTVCDMELWESSLADALEKAQNRIGSETDDVASADVGWENECMINLDDL